MPEFLYIHIPFCIQKCLYCDFFSVLYNESLVKDYTDALCKELSLKKDLASALKTIYIGGGTPSLLPEDCFQQLFVCLKDNYHLSSFVEITVEANPGMINESKIITMLASGVNRLSIGIQSFNDGELKTLGRIHDSADAVKSIELIKKSGMINYSIDLMYGIPGQTMDSWKESLSKAAGFSPAHISTYELTVEEGTPLFEMIKSGNPPSPPFNKGGQDLSSQGMPYKSPPLEKGGKGGFSDKLKMPNEELILEMYNYAIDYFKEYGFEHYEISNFAQPGFRCMHNLNYWDRGVYIGAGAGAHSFINNIRSKNTTDINNYIENLNKCIIPEIESLRLKPEEGMKEFIFLGLRKTEGISISKAEELGLNLLYASGELIDGGCLEIEKDYLRLTKKGVVVSNTVIVKLFEKLGL
jgi:oxygen-independent coproporphyrinogen-3 oxidase